MEPQSPSSLRNQWNFEEPSHKPEQLRNLEACHEVTRSFALNAEAATWLMLPGNSAVLESTGNAGQ